MRILAHLSDIDTGTYHAHKHGSATLHLASGMAGALIIRGDIDCAPAIEDARERIILFQQIPCTLTDHREVATSQRGRQEEFMAFLHQLRLAYPGRPVLLLLDQASCHTALRSQALAAQLAIHLLWLPKQRPELNAMDHG